MKPLNRARTFGLVLSLFPWTGGFAQDAASDEPMTETIKYELKEKLEIQKAAPSIELNVKEIVESGTARTSDVLQEARPIPSDADFENYALLDSDQVIRPWMPLIPEPPLVTFHPGLSNIAADRWAFRVSNERGDVVKTIEGEGLPPRKFEWNGVAEDGQYIQVGTLYSYQFVTFDEHGNAHTFPGEPFKLDALKFQQKKELCVEFPIDRLFLRDEAVFHPAMQGLWQRAIDVVRENSNRVMTVEIHANSVSSPLADERRQTIVQSISDATSIPSVDIRHRIDRAAERGEVVRLVMRLR